MTTPTAAAMPTDCQGLSRTYSVASSAMALARAFQVSFQLLETGAGLLDGFGRLVPGLTGPIADVSRRCCEQGFGVGDDGAQIVDQVARRCIGHGLHPHREWSDGPMVTCPA